MTPTDRARLGDALRYAEKIRDRFAGVTREVFLANEDLQDIALRRLEVIGNAVSKLSPKAEAAIPELDFRAIVGMRNVIAHAYDAAIDMERVWMTIERRLSELIEELDRKLNT